MSSKTPTIKQISWISIIPQLIVMGIIMLLWYLINPEKAILYGTLTYLAISLSLRNLIPKDHKNGMKKVKNRNFNKAISDFKKSYEFFDKNKWIDKYRFLTLLSSSRISYKEMALNNIAFCYGQIGKGIKSKEFYERTLKEFPESGLAKAGLNILNSISSNAPQQKI